MKTAFGLACLLVAPLVFAADALDEGMLPAGRWEGVVFANPNPFRAAVTVSLRRGDALVDEVPLELEPGQTRAIRIDRLFAANADGGAISFRSSQRIEVSGYEGETLTPAAGFTTAKRRSVRSPGGPAPLVTKTITLAPAKDNTLYQDLSGGSSNGAGGHIFAGSTGGRGVRRALLAFNVASQIPPGATVTKVSLTLRITIGRGGPQPMTLHRLTKDWGEAGSNAGFAGDGAGTTAQTNDATWIHTFRPNQRWTNAGGDFEAAPDATTTSGDLEVKWESPGMIARVQQWLDQPSTNFGWLVKGNESSTFTAKRFDSREIGAATLPALTIEYSARQ